MRTRKTIGYCLFSSLSLSLSLSLIDLVNSLGKSYVVWQEIFDNGLKVRTQHITL